MCIENIAEHIMKQYSNILSDKEKRTWQPMQIMKLLAKYEEHTNEDYQLFIWTNKNIEQKFFIGEHKTLSKYRKLSTLYYSLSSHLHYQKMENNISLEKLNKKIFQIKIKFMFHL